MGQSLLGDEGHTDAEWEAAATGALPPSAFGRHLDQAAHYVAAVVARVKPSLLRGLWKTGPVAGTLATVSVTRLGVPVEPVSFDGALARSPSGTYVEADGRLVLTDGGAAVVTAVGYPTDAGELPAVLHDAVVEEAAASLFLALGGNGPEAQGRATAALQAALE